MKWWEQEASNAARRMSVLVRNGQNSRGVQFRNSEASFSVTSGLKIQISAAFTNTPSTEATMHAGREPTEKAQKTPTHAALQRISRRRRRRHTSAHSPDGVCGGI